MRKKKKTTMTWRGFLRTTGKSCSKDEHPFREFFSNFRSKRKIEMNRDEQILSRISDEDLMEYLRMEQKRMELLQPGERSPRKEILDHIPALYLSVIRYPCYLFSEG